MDLAGVRDLDIAEEAVSGMVSMVSAHQHGAQRFRTDDELRKRAIDEILRKVIGLAPGVPGRAARDAWPHRADGQDRLAGWREWNAGRL